jgi:hypothetical protein
LGTAQKTIPIRGLAKKHCLKFSPADALDALNCHLILRMKFEICRGNPELYRDGLFSSQSQNDFKCALNRHPNSVILSDILSTIVLQFDKKNRYQKKTTLHHTLSDKV